MIVTRYILSSDNKIAALSLYRNIQTTKALVFRVGDNKSRRVGTCLQSSLLRRRLMKDSDFTDVNDENGVDVSKPSPNFLEEAYDKQMRELKDETRKINKIIIRKSFLKTPKEPNMLTFNERQHMIFLHESDPVEWSAEHLSESFPALPWAIKKILKNKWIPENEEKIKIMDKAVLENWEKFKNNKLEASRELLEHLKKFIDKRENLEIQLKNPNFFYLPQIKKKLTWKSGHLNSLLLKYEEEVEKLREDSVKVKFLQEKTEGNENMIYSLNNVDKASELMNDNNNKKHTESLTGKDVMKMNLGFQKQKTEKPVTFQELKENIFQKAEDRNNLISPSEEVIIQKTLIKHSLSKTEISKSNSSRSRSLYEENESKSPKMTSMSSQDGEIPEKDNLSINQESMMKGGEGRRRRRGRELSAEKENFDEETYEREIYPKIFNITALGSKFFGAKDEKLVEAAISNADENKDVDGSQVKTTVNKTIKPVCYYNTEKDKQIYENHEKLLTETVFWNSKKRNRSLDAGFASNSLASSPHVASHIQTYFTYDYPLKIKIPENKREKGKLYRVKDCYYDDVGKFLYRVPGMTE